MTNKVTPIGAVRIPGTDIHYAPGMKAGGWVFLTGIEALDYGVGLVPAVAGTAGLWVVRQSFLSKILILRIYRNYLWN